MPVNFEYISISSWLKEHKRKWFQWKLQEKLVEFTSWKGVDQLMEELVLDNELDQNQKGERQKARFLSCFTTEILEGFDVQRTSGLADTLKKYGYLTQAICQYYSSLDYENKSPRVCPPYDEFIGRCEDLDKLTVSDVFAVQLMQVPQVTEEIAIAVLDIYPTAVSLARAYSLLDGDICAQEEILKKQSNNVISGAASKNIFQLIWGS